MPLALNVNPLFACTRHHIEDQYTLADKCNIMYSLTRFRCLREYARSSLNLKDRKELCGLYEANIAQPLPIVKYNSTNRLSLSFLDFQHKHCQSYAQMFVNLNWNYLRNPMQFSTQLRHRYTYNITWPGAQMALLRGVGVQQWLKLALTYGVSLLSGRRVRPRMTETWIPDILYTKQ